MTSPFDKNYKPVIDMTADIKGSKISKMRTDRRQKAMQSPDPQVRMAARGDLGDLSSRTNPYNRER